jgi:hypothetical protein
VSLTGPDWLLKTMTKAVIETASGEELSEHLGYDRCDPAGRGSSNSRNGTPAPRPCSPTPVAVSRSMFRGIARAHSSRRSSTSAGAARGGVGRGGAPVATGRSQLWGREWRLPARRSPSSALCCVDSSQTQATDSSSPRVSRRNMRFVPATAASVSHAAAAGYLGRGKVNGRRRSWQRFAGSGEPDQAQY